MEVLLSLMVLAYVTVSTYIATLLLREQLSPFDPSKAPQPNTKLITVSAIAAFAAKYAVVIGFFVIFYLHYQTLRYWIGSICFVMGLEALWECFSVVRWGPTVPTSVKPTSVKLLTRSLWISGALVIPVMVYFFFDKKLHLYLSLWDLGGIIFFYVSNDVWLLLRFGRSGLVKGRESGGSPPFGAMVVPKHPDAP